MRKQKDFSILDQSPANRKKVEGTVDTGKLEKEFSFHERAGFKAYKKKVGITSTFEKWDV